jgi:hypothetical protein
MYDQEEIEDLEAAAPVQGDDDWRYDLWKEDQMDRHDWPGNRDTCLTRIAAFESEIEQRRRFA